MTATVLPMATELAPAAALAPRPRKWDAEITKARQSDTWLAFEADIHQSAALRTRCSMKSLGRFDREGNPMNALWNLADITSEKWLDPDTYALLAAHYGGEPNLRALAFMLRPDLVKAEWDALLRSDHKDSAHST